MKQRELISIVLPTHNGSKYISQSIKSCLDQSHQNIELIVVNDACNDDTKEVVLSFKDSRIVYLENNANLGLANSLNKGFSDSKGDYLTWTSDDNYYAPDALAKMLSELRKSPGVNFVYANFYTVDDTGKLIGKVKVKKSLYLLINNCVGPCFLYKRRVYLEVGEYDPNFSLAEDYEYWIRVLKNFKMKKINDFLYYYRTHGDSLTSRYTPEKASIALREAFEKHVTLHLRTRYQLMVYADKLKKLGFYKKSSGLNERNHE